MKNQEFTHFTQDEGALEKRNQGQYQGAILVENWA